MSEAQRVTEEGSAVEWKRPVRYTGVRVGYEDSASEGGLSADWFVECYLSADAFHELESAVETGKLTKAAVGVDLTNIYTDSKYSTVADWFIRPRLTDPNGGPDIAHGDISSSHLELNSVWLGPEPECLLSPAERLERKQEREGRERLALHPTATPEVLALNKLASNIEMLRGTVKWVGGFIVLLLFLLVARPPSLTTSRAVRL